MMFPPAPEIQEKENSERHRVEKQVCNGLVHIPGDAGDTRA
jgi:hypothetical protein